MVYALHQNPVPLWAVCDDRPIVLDLPRIPSYLQNKDHLRRSSVTEQTLPAYYTHSGRMGSSGNIQADLEQNQVDGEVRRSILDAYDLHGPFENTLEDEHKEIQDQKRSEHIKRQFLKNLGSNPFFPIFFRGSVILFSIISLALACAVLVQTNRASRERVGLDNVKSHGPASTTIFSIVVNSISIVYLNFSLYDETFGRPLGLRPPQNKIQFVALDLLMLSLNSSNLSLAFDTMISRSYFCHGLYGLRMCSLQKAMTAFVFLVLVIWFLTFLISTFRMIDRATH